MTPTPSHLPVSDCVLPRRGRAIAIVAGQASQILDITGPAEIFSRCTRLFRQQRADAEAYRVVLVTTVPHGRRIETSAGIELRAHTSFVELKERLHTLLVVGGGRVEELAADARFTNWLRKVAPSCARIGSVCTGSFALAGAGLLDGKRVTTHWAWAAQLAKEYPELEVDPDPIFIRDGNVITSAGITAGMDLALSLVEEDFGPSTALQIARELVLYLRRPGTQSQFSAPLSAQLSERSPIRDLQAWLPLHLKEDLSISRLAERAAMSIRHFSRVFNTEMSMSPGEYVDRLRIDAACLRLSESNEGLDRLAAECGFHSPDVMRRTMMRVIRITPTEYRERFGARRKRR